MKGIILLNTGSPTSTNPQDVKFFIGSMLSDPLVMTVPNLIRNILAKNIIAPLRASSSASHYSLIWDNEHNQSPLIYNSEVLARKIEKITGLPTQIAMRYVKPGIKDAFANLKATCGTINEVYVVPMFPQYAQSSYETAVRAIEQYGRTQSIKLNIIKPYYNHPAYISALVHSLKPHIEKEYDLLLFSFHSLPLSHVNRGINKGNEFDYVHQLEETVRLVTTQLNINPSKSKIVYSSAMGKKWLKPDINTIIKQSAHKGAKRIIALTPGFPADNLETLYDIDIVAKANFIKNGGQEFTFVPCLNAQDYWVESLAQIIAEA